MDSVYLSAVGLYLAIDKAVSSSSWIHLHRLDESRTVSTTEDRPKSVDQVTGEKMGVDGVLT